jgi:hypothetical protein
MGQPMKKLLLTILFCLIPCVLFAGGGFTAIMAGGGASGAVCTKADIPNGDIYKESFEDAGYDLGTGATAWNESASPDEDAAIAASTTQNCAYGLRTNSTGTAVYSWNHNAAGKAEIWREFSFYIASHSLTNGQTTIINCASSGTDCSGAVMGKVYVGFSTSGGDHLYIYANADASSSPVTILAETWYYGRIHLFDKGNCTDVDTPYVGCTGSGTGNNSVTLGTTYGGTDIINGETFTATNVAGNPDEFGLGVYTASRTIDIIFGYDAVDDDGTF